MAMLYSQVSLIFDLIINMNNQIGGQNMKYTYAFSDEENTVEIDKKWVDILNEFDKTEQSNDRSELRRKIPLDADNAYSSWLEVTDPLIEKIINGESDLTNEERLHIAINKLKSKQKALIKAIYFDGVSVSEYAAKEGVKPSAISHRLQTAKRKLKKLF